MVRQIEFQLVFAETIEKQNRFLNLECRILCTWIRVFVLNRISLFVQQFKVGLPERF